MFPYHAVSRWTVIPALMLALGLCASCSDPDADLPTPDPVVKASSTGPFAERLTKEFETHRAAAKGLSYADMLKKYRRNYLKKMDFSPANAQHHDGFVTKFSLSTTAVRTLDQHGFVVVPNRSNKGRGPADIYYQVFAADLPVFVSADSILHAWHRTFDKILEMTEHHDLYKVLGSLLSKTAGALDATKADERDALFYLSVATTLLNGTTAPAAVLAEVKTYLSYIQSKAITKVPFMGVNTAIDFSQFIPRGHYTRSETLKKYFMAMMWLGRTDLMLYDATGREEPRPREEAAARALASAMKRSGALPLFQQLDRYYAAFVGRTNAMTPEKLLDLCGTAGLSGCVGNAATMTAQYKLQPAPGYSSRVFAGATPPLTMRFFPQRFAYGSWVTSRTTMPRLKPSLPGGRAMAMPEDVAFALGSDRAAEYFADDMKKAGRQDLPATLEAVRKTMANIKPTTLDDTIFNNWLEALMALSKPGDSAALPQVMRMATWHDRKLESVLASWTELRHDTILIVEQSTGGPACSYPKGYVEPVPALYASLSRAAAQMEAIYTKDSYSLRYIRECMTEWQKTLTMLKTLAEVELAGKAMSKEQLDFINRTVDTHGNGYAGIRLYDGWYPQLFWDWAWKPVDTPKLQKTRYSDHPSGESEPIIADVHTDADTGRALEVATGHPGIMIVAIDNNGDRAIYGGPVSDYYSFAVPASERMTDESWRKQVKAGTMPKKPVFTQSYWSK